MKQNGVVCKPGPPLLFFIFRFEYLILGPVKLPGRSRNGPLVPFAGSATEIIVGPWWFSVGYVTSILVTAVFTSILSSSEHF